MAFEATALAISKATFLYADTGGKMLPSGRSVPREISAKVVAAAMNMPSLIRVAREALNGHRSARSYGVAWQREGSRQNSMREPPALTLFITLNAREGADGQAVVCPLLPPR